MEVENEPFSNKRVAAAVLSRLSFQAVASARSSKSKNLHRHLLLFALWISDVTVPLLLLLLIYNWVYGSSWWRGHVTVWAFLANTAGRTTRILLDSEESQTAFRVLVFSLTREESGDRYMLTVTTLQVKPSWLSWVSPLGRNTVKYSQPQSKMIPAIRVWAPTRFWNTKKDIKWLENLHTHTHMHTPRAKPADLHFCVA